MVTVSTSGEAKLQVIVCDSDMFRIWLDPKGNFVKEPSYAVENEHWDYEDFTLNDTDDAITLSTAECSLVIRKRPMKVELYTSGNRFVMGEYEKYGLGWSDDGAVFMYASMGKDEHFYGLGQDNDAYLGNLDRRGTTRDMITGQTISKGCVTADFPVTFFASTGNCGNGYGLYLDNTYHSEFNMGEESDDYYFFSAEGGELLFYLFYGPQFNKIINQYTNLTGKPSMPPLWALGFIQSKCTYRDWNDMDEVIDTFRKKNIPMDCIVLDGDWHENMVNFKFAERFEGKSEEKIKYHTEKNGVKFMLSVTGPMIKKDSSNFQSGLEANIFATDGKGNTVTCGWYGGELMDFTAPNMKSWLKPQLEPLLKLGVQAWWLDLIEPEGEPLQTVYQGGPRGKIHNAYALLNTKTYYEINKEFDENSRPFLMGRTATAGIQKYGSATWTGDVYSSYETLQAHCPEALNTAMSGIPTWTCDTSGFISSSHDPSLNLISQLYNNDIAAHALLFERWMQFSCFTPITRAHHVGPCEPYAFGELTESSCKHYIQLRYRLLPYIYSYAYRAHITGMSIMRPLIYNYQNDGKVINIKDEYMFGDELLVAPVLTENTTCRKVYFPEGKWIDYDYGYEYEGGKEYFVYAPQNRIPLFVKKGSIIPMAPLMNYTDEKPWDIITLDIYPEKRSGFTMYCDDGRTMAYEKGEFTLTEFTCDCVAGQRINVTISQSNKLFVPEKYRLKIHMDYKPVSINGLNGYSHLKNLEDTGKGWYFDRLRNILYVLFPASVDTTEYSVEIITENSPLYKAPAPELDESGKVITQEKDQDNLQMPYLLPAPTVPCKIQLENYDRGGEGISYHMLSKGNAGNMYRNDDVNIGLCTDEGGGYELIRIGDGEWLEYTVNVEKAGYYDISLRVACDMDDASFHVEFNERNLTGKVSIPNTGSISNWTCVNFDHVRLTAGEQVVKLVIETGKVNLNYLEIKLS